MDEERARAGSGSRLLVAVAAAAVSAAPLPAAAQIPETYENLKVLDEEITRPELVEVMRGFSLGLGVRCHYCHVGEEGRPFSSWDFASDEKPEKRKARFMLEMVRDLNGQRLPALADAADAPRREPPVEVSCRTCHRGVPVPRSLGDALAVVVEEEGVDSAVSEYRRLRSRYHGRGSYDFGERGLLGLGRRLLAAERPGAVIELMELNLEFHPDAVSTRILLADAHLAQGDRGAARAALEEARVLAPEHDGVARRLERLRDGG